MVNQFEGNGFGGDSGVRISEGCSDDDALVKGVKQLKYCLKRRTMVMN